MPLQPLIVVVNKIDTMALEDASPDKREALTQLEKSGATVLTMSTLTEVGVANVRNIVSQPVHSLAPCRVDLTRALSPSGLRPAASPSRGRQDQDAEGAQRHQPPPRGPARQARRHGTWALPVYFAGR